MDEAREITHALVMAAWKRNQETAKEPATDRKSFIQGYSACALEVLESLEEGNPVWFQKLTHGHPRERSPKS